ncbi:S10 family serine carboxypeptidase-like protein [Henriciella aquimarina]|uniref:S10 family serine carboxypeptidase-like protein n=1 Tax=Henriciella aquimarina TaxID=545261 RepID=UPI000A00E6C0|nr:hypothetical protein [Henriciella aquimarina]
MKISPLALTRPAIAAGMACTFLSTAHLAIGQEAAPDWTHVENGQVFSVSDRHADDTIRYHTHWDSLVLDRDGAGAASTISGTAYIRECECPPDERPVMFLFNGGPGASSSPLHFALGPHAREKTDGAASFPDNPDTILRAADLVLVDPVETGFSRAASTAGDSPYLSVHGDAEAVGAFIHDWLKAHDREGAPVFVTGQSYGGFRLANLLPALGDLEVEGLVMVSPMLNAGARAGDMGHVFALPTMAATAWRFGQSSIEADTEAEAWETARAFAESDYLVALQRGDRLDETVRERLAGKIAAMTGLDKDLVEASDLRVNIQDFLEGVLADENRLVSRLNTAVTQEKRPPANPDRPDGANDPSLGLGKSNKIIAADIGTYLERMTGLEREDGYRSLNLDANFAWDWRPQDKAPVFSVNAMPMVDAFMSENENVHLLVFGGYRDLAVPVLETQYALTHAGLPQARVSLVRMASGHSPFDEDALRTPFADRIYDFIAAGLADETGENPE